MEAPKNGSMDYSWIEDKLLSELPKTIGKGGAVVVRLEWKTSTSDTKSYFASSMRNLDVHVLVDGEEVRLSLLVKFLPDSVFVRKLQHSSQQFFNECRMYKEVLPKFVSFKDSSSLDVGFFPKCFYASCEGEESAVVLEDLSVVGFRLGERKSLDYQHCKLALEAIARFHSLSYALKQEDKSSYMDMVSGFKECRLVDDIIDEFCDVMKFTSRQALSYLEGNSEYDDFREKFIKKTEDMKKLFYSLLEPKEPFAVLCHGDYCRNNMLFSYNNQEPTSVKILDFQVPRYASPAIDLSFFIYLSTTPELRQNLKQGLFKVYHDALLISLDSMGIDTVPYDLDSAYKEFTDHALYGYFICSFFLPNMLLKPEDMPEFSDIAQKIEEEGEPLDKVSMFVYTPEALERLSAILKEFHYGKYF